MLLTTDIAREATATIALASRALSAAGVAPVRVAEFVAPTKRLLFTKKARFVEVARAWPLGAVLITVEGALLTVGETTRVVAPGYPGHVSGERERRREITRVASESGFVEGETIYFDTHPIPLDAGAPMPEDSPLGISDETLTIRWNPKLPSSNAVPFSSYISEQVQLRIEQHERDRS